MRYLQTRLICLESSPNRIHEPLGKNRPVFRMRGLYGHAGVVCILLTMSPYAADRRPTTPGPRKRRSPGSPAHRPSRRRPAPAAACAALSRRCARLIDEAMSRLLTAARARRPPRDVATSTVYIRTRERRCRPASRGVATLVDRHSGPTALPGRSSWRCGRSALDRQMSDARSRDVPRAWKSRTTPSIVDAATLAGWYDGLGAGTFDRGPPRRQADLRNPGRGRMSGHA